MSKEDFEIIIYLSGRVAEGADVSEPLKDALVSFTDNIPGWVTDSDVWVMVKKIGTRQAPVPLSAVIENRRRALQFSP